MAGTQLASDLAWQAITSYASIPADIGIGIMAARSVGKVGAEAAAARRAKGAGETAKVGEYKSLGALEEAVKVAGGDPCWLAPTALWHGGPVLGRSESRAEFVGAATPCGRRSRSRPRPSVMLTICCPVVPWKCQSRNWGEGLLAADSMSWGANGRVIVKQTSLGQFDVVGKASFKATG